MPSIENAAGSKFLQLPGELRNHIYDLAIGTTRLQIGPILDDENESDKKNYDWIFPALLFTCRQIYRETAEKIYSQATLAIMPCKRLPNIRGSEMHFLGRYRQDFAFCPTRVLRCIREAHVYVNDQTDKNAFFALFNWLISSTFVESICMSRAAMQVWRRFEKYGPVDCRLQSLQIIPEGPRAVDLFARTTRGGFDLRSTHVVLSDGSPFALRSYLLTGDSEVIGLRTESDVSFVSLRRRWYGTQHGEAWKSNQARVVDKIFTDPLLQRARQDWNLRLFASFLIEI